MAKITVENSIEIAAARDEVFRYIATWQNASCYVPAVELRQTGETGYGPGTRLRGRVNFKGIPVETVSEVVEFVESERIVCRSISGVETTNTWLFAGDGQRTTLTAIVTYRLPGKLLGRIAARFVAKQIAEGVTSSLLNLKDILEQHGDRHT